MVNPFSYFGINDIWPRGFIYKDINKNDIEYLSLASTHINLKPLIYQGLINGKPDVDSIFLLTRIEKEQKLDITFSEQNPLLYLPGNYVPINSKNTKYAYDIFPVLPLPTTINKKISDILRGYIMQYYSWRYNGAVIYHSTDAYKKGYNNCKLSDLIIEKYLYFKLEELLNILNDESFNEINDPIILLLNILNELVSRKILGKNDFEMYKAFIEDLSQYGYVFSHNFQEYNKFNGKYYFDEHFELYNKDIPQQKIFIRNNYNTKLLKHRSSNTVFNDILLAINYNHAKFLKLNDYFINLYSKYFPNIIFIYPGNDLKKANSIACPESNDGFFAYICFRRVFNEYPNFKGYLIIDDDNLMKPWEIDDFDFNIPWTNNLNLRRILVRLFKNAYIYFDNLIKDNKEWHDNLVKYLGTDSIPQLWVEIVYIPNSLMTKFCDIVEPMYHKNIFLEIAIPMAFSQLGAVKYQLCNSILVWSRRERKYMIEYLKKSYGMTFIHPLKFSDQRVKEVNSRYILFINAEDY